MRTFSLVASLLFIGAGHGLLAQEHWVKKFGGLGGDAVHDVIISEVGEIFVCGEFTAGMEVDQIGANSAGALDGFVAKLSSDGVVQWLKPVGGIAVDRCWKIALTPDGNLMVTGQFTGPAELFGFPVPSTNGTLDVFLAKLDGVDGNGIWVRHGGAFDGSDKPNGLAVAPNGNITVVGEFTGTAPFDAGDITSMFDPILQQAGADVFIATYSAEGTSLWLQHGAAPYTDKAVAVVVDEENSIYVCGQFSDTITFDSPHENAMVNAIFIMKLDQFGDEVWFRRCGGAIKSVVGDMLLTANGDLLLCGDVRGTMFFLASGATAVAAVDDHAYYLLQIDAEGEYVRHATTGSTSPVSAKAMDLRADTLAVLGAFQCQFTDLSAFYDADGLFMATGPQDLFVARHHFGDLQLEDAQQFGGQFAKQAGAIAMDVEGMVHFTGSFDVALYFPSEIGLYGDVCNYGGCGLGAGLGFNHGQFGCSDNGYSPYMGMLSNGGRDGILSKAFIRGRAPYDFWNPSMRDEPCSGMRAPFCLTSSAGAALLCPDTVVDCVCDGFSMAPNPGPSAYWSATSWVEPFDAEVGLCLGPALDFQWSDGDTMAWNSLLDGWHWCTVSTDNGCWSWTDSVYVIRECHMPTITDDVVVNQDTDTPWPVNTCEPLWAWTTNTPPGFVVQWYQLGGTDTILNDSIYITQSGTYMVESIGPLGCRQVNGFRVDMPIPPPLQDDLVLGHELYLSDGTLLINDTLVTCPLECVGGFFVPQWTLNGVDVGLDPEVEWSVSLCDGGSSGVDPNGNLPWSVSGMETGWVHWNSEITLSDGLCGQNSLNFQIMDSIYIHVVEVPTIAVNAPGVICPGDTLLLVADCTMCDSLAWSESAQLITMLGSDSAWCIAPTGFVVSAYHTERGVTCSVGEWRLITGPSTPVLSISPTQVCPGDSALVSCSSPGSDIEWTGPSGVMNVQANSIHVIEYGDYYVSLTDLNGCRVSNGPVTLSPYGSPYLQVEPDQVLCPGEVVSIELLTTLPDAVSWNAPLSGSSLVQWVDEPGTYSCSVEYCGLQQNLFVNIVGGDPQAVVMDSGPFVGCTGQVFTLSGLPGQAMYIWRPLDSLTMELAADTTGFYQLIVMDHLGCLDSSDVIVVDLAAAAVLELGLDTAICPGASVALNGTGPYTNWSWSTGEQGSTIVVDQPGEYFLHATDSAGCTVVATVLVDELQCPVVEDTSGSIVPNVITPNGDGANDTWELGKDAAIVEVIIFDRWGNKVFSSDPGSHKWAGLDNNGERLSDGVYYYVLQVSRDPGGVSSVAGYIHLLH